MKFLRSITLGAAAFALAVGSAYAADNSSKHNSKDKDPGFNALDKNHDGYLSRTEAAGNPKLAKQFKQADKNGDGKLSRAEYLAVMAKQDARSLKEKVAGKSKKDKEQSSATGATASSGSTPSSRSATNAPAGNKP